MYVCGGGSVCVCGGGPVCVCVCVCVCVKGMLQGFTNSGNIIMLHVILYLYMCNCRLVGCCWLERQRSPLL